MLAIVIFDIVVVVETPFITQFTSYNYNAAIWHTPGDSRFEHQV